MQVKTTHQLRKGDIVHMHGGTFEVMEDPHATFESPEGYWPQAFVGPSACVVAPSVCRSGVVRGYFSPGVEWNIQGNTRAQWQVQ